MGGSAFNTSFGGKMPNSSFGYQTPPVPQQYSNPAEPALQYLRMANSYNYFPSAPVQGPTNPADIQASAVNPRPDLPTPAPQPPINRSFVQPATGKLSSSSGYGNFARYGGGRGFGNASQMYARGGATHQMSEEDLRRLIKSIIESKE